MTRKNNSGTLGAIMLVAGGIIGAGTALLFAPHSGQRTRRQISRSSRKTRNQAEKMVKDAADSMSDVIEDLGEKSSDLFERGGDMAETWRNHLLKSLDQGQKSLKKQRKRFSELRS